MDFFTNALLGVAYPMIICVLLLHLPEVKSDNEEHCTPKKADSLIRDSA